MALAASAADREVGELEVAVVVEERVVTAAAGFPSAGKGRNHHIISRGRQTANNAQN